MNIISRLRVVFKMSGFKGLVRFLVARILGQSELLRPSSSVDIRRAGLKFCGDVREFVSSLSIEVSSSQIDLLLEEALQVSKEIESNAVISDYLFPENWNSEEQLRVALYMLIRIQKPSLVVETGTANGSSAAAICAALSKNNFGKLLSVDVKDSNASLVSDSNRSFLNLRKTDGSEEQLREVCSLAIATNPGVKFFLHDSDHSYFGQYSDYSLAEELGFDLILSDDIDASLAFIDFAGKSGMALFDTRKIIGGVKS